MLPQIPIARVSNEKKIVLPRYTDGVGSSMFLYASVPHAVKIAPQKWDVIATGIAIALPVGIEAQVRSLKDSTTKGVFVLNAPLTIDASDRKEITVCIYNASKESVIIKQGDAIALLVFSPVLRVEWNDFSAIQDKKEKQNEDNLSRGELSTPDVSITTQAVSSASKIAFVEKEVKNKETEPLPQEQKVPSQPVLQNDPNVQVPSFLMQKNGEQN